MSNYVSKFYTECSRRIENENWVNFQWFKVQIFYVSKRLRLAILLQNRVLVQKDDSLRLIYFSIEIIRDNPCLLRLSNLKNDFVYLCGIYWSGRDSQLLFLVNSVQTRPGWVPQSSKLKSSSICWRRALRAERSQHQASELPSADCSPEECIAFFRFLLRSRYFQGLGDPFPPTWLTSPFLVTQRSDEQTWPFLFTAMSSSFVNKKTTFIQVSEHCTCTTHEHMRTVKL